MFFLGGGRTTTAVLDLSAGVRSAAEAERTSELRVRWQAQVTPACNSASRRTRSLPVPFMSASGRMCGLPARSMSASGRTCSLPAPSTCASGRMCGLPARLMSASGRMCSLQAPSKSASGEVAETDSSGNPVHHPAAASPSKPVSARPLALWASLARAGSPPGIPFVLLRPAAPLYTLHQLGTAPQDIAEPGWRSPGVPASPNKNDVRPTGRTGRNLAMNSQTSKAALHNLDMTEFLVMSTRTQKPNVSTRLTEVFRPALPRASSSPPSSTCRSSAVATPSPGRTASRSPAS